MKRILVVVLLLVIMATFVYSYSTVGPTSDSKSNQTVDLSESTGSVTGIHPPSFKRENTVAMLILAFMGVALFAVLTYCKRNI